MNTVTPARFAVLGLATLFTACDGGGNGGGSGAGPAPTPTPPPVVASVNVTPPAWDATRIGQRQQLAATAQDADGNTISGTQFTWGSSDTTVAVVDSNGLVTANSAGNALVTATSEGKSAAVSMTVKSAVPSAVGDMYTLWPARSDDSPVLLVNGSLKVRGGIYCRNLATEEIIVCPTPLPEGDDGQKEPDPTSPWKQGGVAKFQWARDRIGILSDMSAGRGTFRVVDRHDEWAVLAVGNASAFQLEGNRIGVVVDDGTFMVADGIHGPWSTLGGIGIRKFQLEGNRIAMLRQDGMFLVQNGIDGAPTILAYGGIRDFQLEGNRIAVLGDEGLFRVQNGIDGNPTTLEANGLRKFQLEGNRIAVWREDGIFRVKDGIHGAWTTLANGGIRDFQLEGNRIGLWQDNGVFRVKDGIHGAWTTLANGGLSAFQLQEDFIGVLTEAGVLKIKKGINGAWRQTPAYGTDIAQFRLIVDVPSPPVRTTPDTSVSSVEIKSYAYGQEVCHKNQPVDCTTPIQYWLPAPWYGRFCGRDNPAEDVFWVAMNAGPIDSLDYICQHHDRATPWYPGETVTHSQACIVRYGLDNARLTRDGRQLTAGTGEWSAVWSRMADLRDAVALYKDTVTNKGVGFVCGPKDLVNFTRNTAAKHN